MNNFVVLTDLDNESITINLNAVQWMEASNSGKMKFQCTLIHFISGYKLKVIESPELIIDRSKR